LAIDAVFCHSCGKSVCKSVIIKKNTLQWYLYTLKNYAIFSGRAQRKEYWNFVACNILMIILLNIAGVLSEMGETFSNIYSLAAFLPSIAVAVRRMHDIGRNGWWILLPFVNLYFLLRDSQPGRNEYGEAQK